MPTPEPIDRSNSSVPFSWTVPYPHGLPSVCVVHELVNEAAIALMVEAVSPAVPVMLIELPLPDAAALYADCGPIECES